MEHWGDELVERLRKETWNRPGFSIEDAAARSTLRKQQPANAGWGGHLSANPKRPSTDRFAVIHRQTPKSIDDTTLPQGFITPQGFRAPNPHEVEHIFNRIARASTCAGEVLEKNNRLWTHHILTIWLSENYRPSREGASPQVAQVLDAVAADLETRLGRLIDDLVRGDAMTRRTAAAVASEMHVFAYTVGENLIDDMKSALTVAAKNRDLAVRNDATIALAKIARKFYGREGMISTAIMTLLETIDEVTRRGDETFILGPMADLIRTYDMLTAHPKDYSRFVDGLRPYSIEVLRGIDRLRKLMAHGASSAVRKIARDTLDAIAERMSNSSLDGTPGACPVSGSSAPPTPPIDGWWGAAAFQSMAQYVGMNTAPTMPLPQIPRVF